MDWITTWADGHFAVGVWIGAAALALGWLIGPSIRALRRSEPSRSESSYHTWHQRQGWPVLRHSCTVCKYQPTSPPPSAPTTGLTPGQSARLSANLAFHLRKQAQQENED